MAGLYVPNMELPDTCFKCRFMFARRHCLLNTKIDFYSYENYDELEKRVDDCPLVYVPDHGRLIEADALIERLKPVETVLYRDAIGTWHDIWDEECAEIAEMPTIVPADKKGG